MNLARGSISPIHLRRALGVAALNGWSVHTSICSLLIALRQPSSAPGDSGCCDLALAGLEPLLQQCAD